MIYCNGYYDCYTKVVLINYTGWSNYCYHDITVVQNRCNYYIHTTMVTTIGYKLHAIIYNLLQYLHQTVTNLITMAAQNHCIMITTVIKYTRC